MTEFLYIYISILIKTAHHYNYLEKFKRTSKEFGELLQLLSHVYAYLLKNSIKKYLLISE